MRLSARRARRGISCQKGPSDQRAGRSAVRVARINGGLMRKARRQRRCRHRLSRRFRTNRRLGMNHRLRPNRILGLAQWRRVRVSTAIRTRPARRRHRQAATAMSRWWRFVRCSPTSRKAPTRRPRSRSRRRRVLRQPPHRRPCANALETTTMTAII